MYLLFIYKRMRLKNFLPR
uniref:Uncharacterized protein n=1 Tax=Anguilla anguilla TaxID=7936 RepID=A0A0E9UFH8_ANGAN